MANERAKLVVVASKKPHLALVFSPAATWGVAVLHTRPGYGGASFSGKMALALTSTVNGEAVDEPAVPVRLGETRAANIARCFQTSGIEFLANLPLLEVAPAQLDGEQIPPMCSGAEAYLLQGRSRDPALRYTLKIFRFSYAEHGKGNPDLDIQSPYVSNRKTAAQGYGDPTQVATSTELCAVSLSWRQLHYRWGEACRRTLDQARRARAARRGRVPDRHIARATEGAFRLEWAAALLAALSQVRVTTWPRAVLAAA